MWGAGEASGSPSSSPKTPTTRSPFTSGTALISTGTRVPAGRDQDSGRVCRRGGPEHLPGEQFLGTSAVLGCDDGGEMAAANVAEELLGCRIDPANDPRSVEDVARDADVFQSPLDVAADSQTGDHGGKCR